MPCHDITEQIQIAIDRDDRLISYTLCKKSCGGILGQESLLIDKLKGMTTKQISAIDDSAFKQLYVAQNDIEEFVSFKHFYAIKSALETLTGGPDGDAGSPCKIAKIIYDDNGIVLDADIAVNLVTEKIRACGICAGCGVKSFKNGSTRKARVRISKGTRS